jgi:formyltetrahydrofolate-dependent phosphoribosylglycinamide formyltransferase
MSASTDSTPSSSSPLLRVGVLISGSGTTLGNFLTERAAGRLPIDIPVVIADRDCSGVERARQAGLACCVVPRAGRRSVAEFSREIFDRLRTADVQVVALAGFLNRVEIPADFAGRVLNIHPALIPAFCGRGMYGRHVHAAVLERGCTVSGCTVHFADNEYDHGPIILQRCVAVRRDDTPESLAARVFATECEVYPEVLRLFASGRIRLEGGRVQLLPE